MTAGPISTRVRVIYIVGSGRSGSTVLDTVLGNHPNVESVGELAQAPRVLMNSLEYCACGELADSCAFWTEIQKSWTHLWPRRPPLTDWVKLQRKFERPKNLLLLILERTRRTRSFSMYLKGVETFYEAIREVAGKNVIVDSSKNPVRAFAIGLSEKVDLRLIHLVRDGRGVIWSYNKDVNSDPAGGVERHISSRGALRTSLQWTLNNRAAEIAGKVTPPEQKLFLRYEDFISAPVRSLARIEQVSGLDCQDLSEALIQGRDFPVGHTIAGNRVRMRKSIHLELDNEWREHLTPAQRLIFRLLAGRMARRYGYVDA